MAHWAGALGRRFARGVLLCVAVLQPIAGFLDGIENIGLFAMLTNGAVTPDVHAWTLGVSTVKWWLVTAGVLTPIGGSLYLLIARRKSGQGGAPVPAAGTAQVQVANR